MASVDPVRDATSGSCEPHAPTLVPSEGCGEGRRVGRREALRRWYRESVWAPAALRAAGVLATLATLAGLGAYSMLSGLRGVPVPERSLEHDFHGAWLALGAASANRPSSEADAGATTARPELGDHGGGRQGAAAPCSDPLPGGTGITREGRVILNLATEEELRRIPGVGARRAADIVALRARLGGRFRKPTDLLRVKGIGPRSLRRMMEHCVLDPPPAPPPSPGPGGTGPPAGPG